MSSFRSSRRLRSRVFAVLATLALVAVGTQVPLVAAQAADGDTPSVDCSMLAAGQPCTMSYRSDLEFHTFQIPAGVDEITFILSGASGGGEKGQSQSAGGAGGVVIGTMAVDSHTTEGRWLYAILGQSGQGVHQGATDGWGGGARGGEGTLTTGGTGGGSSALLNRLNPIDPTLVSPLAGAGGGGGGGSYAHNYPPLGGAGGAGGKPAQHGADGGGTGTWGPGGKGGAAQFEVGTHGGDDGQGFDGTGGGGGGGGARHGGLGGDSGDATAAAGGGGGGDSWVDESIIHSAVYNSGHVGHGQLTIYPGTGIRKDCVSGHAPRQLEVPHDVAAYAFVAVGGSGEHGSDVYHHEGTGGVVSGVLDVTGIETLDYWVGCSGYSNHGDGYGVPGAGGDAPDGGNDGGRGGGASAIADHATGTMLVAAGGGGGQGGDTTACGGAYRDDCGGPGGNSAGKPGTSFPADGTDGGGRSGDRSGPGGDGGCANCEGGKHPTRDGGDGVSPDAAFTGAGGGGGSGYPAGGHGGHHSVDDPGGGGGAGGSYFSHAHVSDGSMAPRGITGNGFVLFIPIPAKTTTLTVEKTISGDGTAFATAPFGVEVECRLGSEVILHSRFQLAAGAERAFEDLRQGASCTITETGTGGASVPAAPRTVVLGATPTTITLDNAFLLEDLEVRVFSLVVGEGGGPNPGTSFDVPDVTVDVTCTFDGRPLPLPAPVAGGQLTFDGATTLTGAGAAQTIAGLPVGAECTVARTPGGVAVVEYGVNGGLPTSTPAQITIGTSGNSVHVVDGYVLAPLRLHLVAAGTGTPPADAVYRGTVRCTVDGEAVTLPSDQFEIAVGATIEVHDLPTGAVCSLEDVDPGLAVATTYSPARTVSIAHGVEITLTAAFDDGSLLVAVSASGAGAGWAQHAPSIAVTCIVDGTTVLDETFTAPSAAGGWVAYEVSAGAECSAQQQDPFGATSVLYRSNTAPDASTSPVQVTVPADAGAALFVEDVFTAAPLRIVAGASGAGAGYALPPTARISECEFAGEPIDPVAGSASVDLPLPGSGGAVRLSALPTGASCLVSEPDAGGATEVEASQERGEPSVNDGPGAIWVTVQDGGPALPTTVRFDNVFDVGALTVTKTVDGDGAAFATRPFTVEVTCTFAGAPLTAIGPGGVVSLTFAADGALVEDAAAERLQALPMGTSCSAGEVDAGGATTVTYSPAGTASTSGPVVVAPGAPQIAITNTFQLTSLSVTPTVTGTDAADYADAEFWYHAGCTFQGAALPPMPQFGLTPGSTRTLSGLPVGAVCSVQQVVDHHATQVAPEPTQSATLTPEPVALTWANAFDSTPVTVTETLSGDGMETYADGAVFTAKVDCTSADGSADALLPGNGVLMLSAENGYAAALAAPVGATCDVAQFGVPVSRVTLPDPVLVALGSTLELPIQSEFWLSPLRITATATGPVPAAPRFGFTVVCEYGSSPVPFAAGGDGAFSLAPGGTRSLQTLAGVDCTATETDTGGATATSVTVTGMPTVAGASARFLSSTDPITVTFANTFGRLPSTGAALLAALPVAAALLLGGTLLALLGFSRRRRAEAP